MIRRGNPQNGVKTIDDSVDVLINGSPRIMTAAEARELAGKQIWLNDDRRKINRAIEAAVHDGETHAPAIIPHADVIVEELKNKGYSVVPKNKDKDLYVISWEAENGEI